MTKSPCITSQSLKDIQRMCVAELVAQPTEQRIELPRYIITLLQASLGALSDEVAVLEERAACADRLTRELAIALADKAHLELRLTISDFLASGRSPEPAHVGVDWGRECHERDRAQRPPYDPMGKGREERRHHRTAKIIDLTEELARERRDAGRPIGPEGGAA